MSRRPIPSVGSKIILVNQELSIKSPRIDLTRQDYDTAREISQVSIETEGNMTKSNLMIEENDNMIFKLKSGRSHYKQVPPKADQTHIILSECSEVDNSEEIDNFISNI